MVSALADAVGHATRLADTDADAALVVANNHDCAEGEAAATLDNLRYALNIDDTFVEFFAFLFTVTGRTLVAVALGFIVTATCAFTTGFITARSIAAWSVATAATLRFLLWLICHFTSTLKF
jgi:hypothetical protein